MDPDELRIVLELAETGFAECPWTWVSDWPEGVTGDDAQEVLRKFRQYVKERT